MGPNYGISEEHRASWAAESRSKVTFEIEPLGQMVKLTVLHDGVRPGQRRARGRHARAAPAILASLETLLETGEALPAPPPAGQAE